MNNQTCPTIRAAKPHTSAACVWPGPWDKPDETKPTKMNAVKKRRPP